MSDYILVTDSNHRTFIKEKGYGFIGIVRQLPDGMREVLPQNKGCDMTQTQLMAALIAVEGVAMTRDAVKTATREELQAYLESRGFAVYAKDKISDLRVAARMQMAQERRER